MTKQRLPFRYKGGSAKWEQDRAKASLAYERALAGVQHPDVPDSSIRLQALFGSHLALGLFRAWEGDGDRARAFLTDAAAAAHAYVGRVLPGLTPSRAPGIALVARDGAAAAALVGNGDLARTLFGYAEASAAGLVPGGGERPAHHSASLDPLAVYPLTRAYSLLRMGQLSGFHAWLYPAPLPEARRVPPEWRPADVAGLLDTAEICLVLGKPNRPADYPAEQGLPPLLRALAACLAAPDPAPDRAAAQAALTTYFGLIRNLADFRDIYLVVLDLQIAFPQVFTPVAPGAL